MVVDKVIDIFNKDVDVIVHQANCFHTMGGGIAKIIKEKFPEAYEVDKKTLYGAYDKLGDISVAKIKNETAKIKYIINQYSQYSYGHEKMTNYEAFYNCLLKVRARCAHLKVASVAYPHKIGCDLAGGDWRIIRPMFDVVFESADFDVYICQKPK